MCVYYCVLLKQMNNVLNNKVNTETKTLGVNIGFRFKTHKCFREVKAKLLIFWNFVTKKWGQY